MKHAPAFVIIILTTLFISCSPTDSTDDDSNIEYVDTGAYGVNLLDTNITNFQGNEFSFSATIPNNEKLVVKLKKVSGGNWFIASGTEKNWALSSYDSSTESQTFSSINDEEICDLKMEILTGKYIIEYYEGEDSTPTRIKEIEI